MGSLSESFANLGEAMQADYAAPIAGNRRPAAILMNRLLKPLLPSTVRCGTGTVVDVKDRQVGPFDIAAAWEAFPPLGEGPASIYAADGVIFVVQARDWSKSDLTEFGRLAADLKKLERKRKPPVFCAAVSFETLALDQVSDFLKSPGGEAVDGVFTLHQHAMIRNSQGWYGDPARVPFVSERNGTDALKSFSLFLIHLSQSFIGLPFGLADYQHL